MTKAGREKFRRIKNLVADGKENLAEDFKRVNLVSDRIYSDAVDAGRRLRKEAQNG